MIRSHIFPCLAILLLHPLGVRAADPPMPKPGDAMIEKYLAHETDKLSQRFLDGAKTLEEWQGKLPRLRQEYLDMLGLWPLPEKTPLQAKITGTLEHEGVVIEKLHFQSRPGLYVTGNLYRAKGATGKRPAVLYVCGHSGRGRDGNKTAFQEHGMWFATNGYVCLIIDTLQLGEVAGIHHGTYNRGRWWWQALGYTPAGVECWNGIRALDYLVSRPDVDADRLAVTGISGGGASTFWIAAADQRVTCAVPVSGMSDLESYVKNKVINGHCDCMFLVNTYRWEWTTIAALVAPRPLLFCNSDQDPIFPMDANRRIIERLRKLYTMYGKPELVDDYVSKGGHDYRPDLRIAIFKWINKHVKNDTGPVHDAKFKPIPGKELRVFPEDKDLPKDAINGRVDECFVPSAPTKLAMREIGGFVNWKQALLKELKARSFRAFPDEIPPAKRGRQKEQRIGIKYREIPTEAGLAVELYGIPEPDKGGIGTLLVVNEEELKGVWDGSWPDAFLEAIFEDGRKGLLMCRGEWTRRSPPNYVERAHTLLGKTVDQGRVWDIAATIQLLHSEAKGKHSWRVVALGKDGILAVYAALLAPPISEVVIIDPPTSHRDGPIFLNVLRVLDIPEALGLLAPRKLTLINAKDKAFDRTAEIYKLAGAENKFQRK